MIFRSYDVRGRYPEQLNESIAKRIGFAFGKLWPGTIAVGMDARLSSNSLKNAILKGLASAGCEIIDTGLVPTPLLYFTVAKHKLDGGIMVTASHNPAEYNGFKFCIKGARCLSYESGIKDIEKIANSCKVKDFPVKSEKIDVVDEYIDFVLKKTDPKQLKIVVDAGNGSAGYVAKKLFNEAGCDVDCIFCEPDGRFPNHIADPMKPEVLADLQKKVIGRDIGIAFDGDGDRLGVVDENGSIVPSNCVFALLAKRVLEKNRGAKILLDVVVSQAVIDVIKQNSGIPIVSRVGHSHIQAKLLDEGCAFAGENSGHYYFAENFGYDDALFAALKVLELEMPISRLWQSLPRYFSSHEFRPECPDEKKFEVIERLKERLKEYELITIDGVKVILPNGWFIVRASNTAPQLVVRWEARDEKSFKEIESMVRNELEAVGVKLK